jgi:D-alanyl-D-alanine carboxypeptidase/D-alanyl-D-alanine-endopeptidase (penicillin-binding protein 4)
MRGRLVIVAATAAAAALAFGATASAGGVGSLDRKLAAALAARGVAARTSTAVVVELPSGRTVYSRNASLPLQPASNEKLSVTYAALLELGPSYRFPTEVLGEGRRSGTTWRGTLVLKGYGDPALTTGDLERLVGILWREGIRKVTGSLVADASYFDRARTAPGWLPSFAGLESPPLSALVVDRAVRDGVLVSNPPLATAIDFETLLRARGILTGHVTIGRASPGSGILATIYSAPLAQLLEFMDHVSDNFTAEMVLKAIGAQAFGLGTTRAGARLVRADLVAAGIPLAGVRIVDGSGLSRLDRATGAELSALLVAIWKNATLRTIVLAALPVAGESGTLAYRMTASPARGLVHAKTGTTDIASALSGFVGRRYAFAVVENGDPVDWSAARATQDQFADTLAARVASG